MKGGAMEETNVKDSLCFPLYAASRKVINSYAPYLKPLGLTYTQYLVLSVLFEKDHVPVSEIGAKLYLDSGTLTPLLKKMEKEGYLSRKRCNEDERVVRVCLLEKGKALAKPLSTIPGCVRASHPLTPEQSHELAEILQAILAEKGGSSHAV
jgi:DNA-binding MarR family transcriptional regulator